MYYKCEQQMHKKTELLDAKTRIALITPPYRIQIILIN